MKRIYWFTIFLVIFSLANIVQSYSKTYYVATNGLDSNSGTISNPFRTIQKAANIVTAGDSVIVRSGTYAAFKIENKNGTIDSPIIFMRFPGEKVIVDHYLGGGDGYNVIRIINSGYIIIDSFKITDSNPELAHVTKLDPNNPDDFEIIKRHIDEDGVRLISSGGEGPDHIILRNLEVYNIARVGISGYGKGHYNQFINNDVHHVGAYGFYINGTNHLFKNNIVHDNKSLGMNLGNSTDPIYDSIIEGNILYNNGSENYYNASSGSIGPSGDGVFLVRGWNNVIRNNLCYNNRGWGIRSKGGNNLIVNNTVYRNGRQGIYSYYNQNDEIINNISYLNMGKDGYPGDYYIGAGNISSHNLFGINPQFFDPDSGDFYLREDSPAIDAGIPVSGFDYDIINVHRPQKDNWDIGAFEFINQSSINIDLNVNPKSGGSPLIVHFACEVAGGHPPYNFRWNFGDGITSDLKNPTHIYDKVGLFNATLIVKDSNNEQARVSQSINVKFEDRASITDVKFTKINDTQEITTIAQNRWYNLYLYFDDPKGLYDIAYADVWLSYETFKNGTIENRGGNFIPDSNYVISYSIATSGIWEKENKGWANIMGKLGLYVDDDNGEYIQNDNEHWAKARVKLLRDRKSTRLNSSHIPLSRMPSSA